MKSFVRVFCITPISIVPVTAHLADLLAAGSHGEAVFMKVFLRQSDYEAAIAQRA